MSAQQRQKRSGNTYNLSNRVEIPTELQVTDKEALADEFSSQPISGQVLPSLDPDSDTGSSIDISLVFVNNVSESDSELVSKD